MQCGGYARCVYRHRCLLETLLPWCAICASGNGAGAMETRIWLMHLAKPSREPEDRTRKKAAQKMQPSRRFVKTDPKSVTFFRAVFFDSPEIHSVENHHFASVKTQFWWFRIFWFCKKCTTTSAVFNPAGCFCCSFSLNLHRVACQCVLTVDTCRN